MGLHKIYLKPDSIKNMRTSLLVLLMNMGLLILNLYFLIVDPKIFNVIMLLIPLIGVIILFKALFIKYINWYIMKYLI